eukprot:7162048-Pyramimonas_sp.AAC.1
MPTPDATSEKPECTATGRTRVARPHPLLTDRAREPRAQGSAVPDLLVRSAGVLLVHITESVTSSLTADVTHLAASLPVHTLAR